jgi:hypothetical protein
MIPEELIKTLVCGSPKPKLKRQRQEIRVSVRMRILFEIKA